MFQGSFAQIMAPVHKARHDALFARLESGEHRTLWRSHANKTSGVWLVVIPPQQGAKRWHDRQLMPDANFIAAIWDRLHARTTPRPLGMVPEAFKCRIDGKQLDEYGHHAQSCSGMQACRTVEHTFVKNALAGAADLARDVHSMSEVETAKLGFVPREGVYAPSSGNAATFIADLAVNKDPNGLRNAGMTIVADVTITGPLTHPKANETGPLMVNERGVVVSGNGKPQGAAANLAAAAKDKKYLGRLHMEPAQFYAFAMESSGYMHPRAVEYVKELARLQSSYLRQKAPIGLALQRSSVGARYRYIIERVAMAQQLGHSRMLLNYQQKCVPR